MLFSGINKININSHKVDFNPILFVHKKDRVSPRQYVQYTKSIDHKNCTRFYQLDKERKRGGELPKVLFQQATKEGPKVYFYFSKVICV